MKNAIIILIILTIIFTILTISNAHAQVSFQVDMPDYHNASAGCLNLTYHDYDHVNTNEYGPGVIRYEDFQVVFVGPSRQAVTVILDNSAIGQTAHGGQLCLGAGSELGLWQISHIEIDDTLLQKRIAYVGIQSAYVGGQHSIEGNLSGQLFVQIGLFNPTVTPTPTITPVVTPSNSSPKNNLPISWKNPGNCGPFVIARFPNLTVRYNRGGCINYIQY